MRGQKANVGNKKESHKTNSRKHASLAAHKIWCKFVMHHRGDGWPQKIQKSGSTGRFVPENNIYVHFRSMGLTIRYSYSRSLTEYCRFSENPHASLLQCIKNVTKDLKSRVCDISNVSMDKIVIFLYIYYVICTYFFIIHPKVVDGLQRCVASINN